FSTLITNIFTLGEKNQSLVSLPSTKGVALSITQNRRKRLNSVHNE
ncbi:hypothetical protein KIPB_011889, partial [Kipferlia bialata]